MGHRAALISVSIALSTTLHCEATDSGLSTFIIHRVLDKIPTYPRMDGQAELTWMAGYMTRWFGRQWSPRKNVTHASTNPSRLRVSMLNETND